MDGGGTMLSIYIYSIYSQWFTTYASTVHQMPLLTTNTQSNNMERAKNCLF